MAVVMPVLSMRESVERRMTNPHGQPSRKLWRRVWKNFRDMYEVPTVEEGFNSILYVEKEKTPIKKNSKKTCGNGTYYGDGNCDELYNETIEKSRHRTFGEKKC